MSRRAPELARFGRITTDYHRLPPARSTDYHRLSPTCASVAETAVYETPRLAGFTGRPAVQISMSNFLSRTDSPSTRQNVLRQNPCVDETRRFNFDPSTVLWHCAGRRLQSRPLGRQCPERARESERASTQRERATKSIKMNLAIYYLFTPNRAQKAPLQKPSKTLGFYTVGLCKPNRRPGPHPAL